MNFQTKGLLDFIPNDLRRGLEDMNPIPRVTNSTLSAALDTSHVEETVKMFTPTFAHNIVSQGFSGTGLKLSLANLSVESPTESTDP